MSHPASEVRGDSLEEPTHLQGQGWRPGGPPHARGQGQQPGEQIHAQGRGQQLGRATTVQGVVAAMAQEGLEELSHIEGQEGRQ